MSTSITVGFTVEKNICVLTLCARETEESSSQLPLTHTLTPRGYVLEKGGFSFGFAL